MSDKNERPKILIVDDEEVNLKIISAILKTYNYDIETSKNGVDALQKAITFSPDLIFLDLMMPQMDGFDVCRRLKQDTQTRDIPVVMITAIADEEMKRIGLEAGASDFLTKPVGRTALLSITENILKNK